MSDSALLTNQCNIPTSNSVNSQYQIIHMNQNDFNRLSSTASFNFKQEYISPPLQQQQQQLQRSPLLLHNQQQQQLLQQGANFNQLNQPHDQYMLVQSNQTN